MFWKNAKKSVSVLALLVLIAMATPAWASADTDPGQRQASSIAELFEEFAKDLLERLFGDQESDNPDQEDNAKACTSADPVGCTG